MIKYLSALFLLLFVSYTCKEKKLPTSFENCKVGSEESIIDPVIHPKASVYSSPGLITNAFNGGLAPVRMSSYMFLDKDGNPVKLNIDEFFDTTFANRKPEEYAVSPDITASIFSESTFKNNDFILSSEKSKVRWHELKHQNEKEKKFKYIGFFYEGLAQFTPMQSNPSGMDLKGFINEKGEITIEAQFDEVSNFSDGMAYYCNKTSAITSLCGYINTRGEKVIEAKYGRSSLSSFNEGYALAYDLDRKKLCIIDREGKVSSELEEKFTGSSQIFSEGLIAVRDKYFDYFYVNKNGKKAFEQGFHDASPFSDGLASVKDIKSKLYGYIDKTGKYVIEPTFYYASGFKDGRAAVWFRKNGEVFFINTEGKVVHGGYDSATSYNNGLTLVYNKNGYGYVNVKGQISIVPLYNDATSFNEGYAVVNKHSVPGKSSKQIIDTKGNITADLSSGEFIASGSYSEGVVPVQFKDNQWGYYDISKKTAERLHDTEARQLGELTNGIGTVSLFFEDGYNSHEYYYYVNKKLDALGTGPNYQYYAISSVFIDNIAVAKEYKTNRVVIIDKTGKVLKVLKDTQEYDWSGFSEEGLLKFGLNGKYGFLNKTGEVAIPPEYADTSGFHNGLAPVKKGNDWGYINKENKMVIDDQFSRAYIFSDGLASVEITSKKNKNTIYAVIDKNGNYVVGPSLEKAKYHTEGLVVIGTGNATTKIIDLTSCSR